MRRLLRMAYEDSDVPGCGVVVRPDTDELVQVMWSEDGGVTCQVLEIIHDDGHEQI